MRLRPSSAACADRTPAGARAAGAFALMGGCGLRRAETAGIDIDHLDRPSGAIRILGKGNRERTV